MKKLIIIALLLFTGCVTTQTTCQCPTDDIVVIGDYEGYFFPMLLEKGILDDPEQSWLYKKDWDELIKQQNGL